MSYLNSAEQRVISALLDTARIKYCFEQFEYWSHEQYIMVIMIY